MGRECDTKWHLLTKVNKEQMWLASRKHSHVSLGALTLRQRNSHSLSFSARRAMGGALASCLSLSLRVTTEVNWFPTSPTPTPTTNLGYFFPLEQWLNHCPSATEKLFSDLDPFFLVFSSAGILCLLSCILRKPPGSMWAPLVNIRAVPS